MNNSISTEDETLFQETIVARANSQTTLKHQAELARKACRSDTKAFSQRAFVELHRNRAEVWHRVALGENLSSHRFEKS